MNNCVNSSIVAEGFTNSSDMLGNCYPYWWRDETGIRVSQWASDAFPQVAPERRTVDPVAVLSMLGFEYICQDRTVVQGVHRLPWLSTLHPNGEVTYAEAPPHGDEVTDPDDLAQRFYDAYRKELRRYCTNADKVFVLLSGGMDSRVMAGTLHNLQEEGLVASTVEAVTWGIPESRDVAYSQHIARILGWKWNHVPLTSETYWSNFELAARQLGGEVDPKHLHRMDWFATVPPNSVVLAASYGDSVGRAEFSSVHLTQLAPLEPNDRNRILRRDAYVRSVEHLRADIRSLRERHGERSELGWREVERQAHYMRRHLCNTMCVINRWAKIEQSFVNPEVYRLMWAQTPETRTDEMYTHLLRLVNPELLEMPWARTGARYGSKGALDALSKSFHQYGLWLRRDHADRIEALLFGGRLDSLEIFDMNQVKWLFREWKRERLADNTTLCTQLSWLATLARTCEIYDIQPPRWGALERSAISELADRVYGSALKSVARASQVGRRVTRPLRVQ